MQEDILDTLLSLLARHDRPSAGRIMCTCRVLYVQAVRLRETTVRPATDDDDTAG